MNRLDSGRLTPLEILIVKGQNPLYPMIQRHGHKMCIVNLYSGNIVQ